MPCDRCDGPGGEITFRNQVVMPVNGKVICIDWCIHHIVAALNAGGVRTVASCCGHGKQDGRVDLEDGRVLIVKSGGWNMNNTGESTASINKRVDDESWPAVKEGLEKRMTLWKPPRLANYYLDRGNGDYGGGCLSPARVRKLEAEGVLVHVGVCRYALADKK
ncbi:MAG: hypothetical protein WD407_08765 [Rhodospirillales bacterium]